MMPGVDAERLTIDLRDDTLTLRGTITDQSSPEWSPLLVEYDTGTYLRRFSLSEAIDQTKIEAQMKNGVLRLVLPKVEKAAPRRITVKAV